MSFQHPGLLLAGLLLLAPWFLRSRAVPALSLGPAFLLESLPGGGRTRWQHLLVVAEAIALLGLVVALARPVREVALPSSVAGAEILLCLDRSSSMQAHDLDPLRTRMQLAQSAAQAFVQQRDHDRIGLIAFARYPDLLSPTTLDQAAIGTLIEEVALVEANGAEDLTGIGTAVARAAQVLSTREARSRLIVLLTDGEENVATPASPTSLKPVEAAALCRSLGIRVYPIAVGVESAGLTSLRQLAASTGGASFAAQDAAALPQVFTAIDRLEQSPLDDPRFEVQEAFLPFLLGGMALLFLVHLLRLGPMQRLP